MSVAVQVDEAIRERLVSWAMDHGFSTGHADTIEELLHELSWQVKELRDMDIRERGMAI